jgi:hypothetical protein
MFATVVYLVVSHIRMIRASRQFDRSIHGDLNHVISLAIYRLHISQMLRWNLLPLGVIMIFSGLGTGKLFMISTLILASNTLAFYAISKGMQANKRRIRALQALKEKLETGS